MTRQRRVIIVVIAGIIAGSIAHFIDASSQADALCFLATGIVVGELLVLRLEDATAIPLSYAVLVVLASSFALPDYASAVLGAELIFIVLRLTNFSTRQQLAMFVERIAVAAATLLAYRLAWGALHHREHVAQVLLALATAALAQVVVVVVLRHVMRQSSSLSARGRLAWLAIASSGMLMAIGYRGVGGEGKVGIWGPLLFSTPLLAAWYAFERLDSATRSYRQTIEALAMAPELGGLVPAGHAQRVAALAAAMGDQLGLSASDVRDLEMAALLHHLGQVTLDETTEFPGSRQAEVAAITSAMMREIRPLSAAGDIVAGETDDPKRRLAVQVLRIASEYDDMTARDSTPGDLAIESLRSAPAYVYEERVIRALERAVRGRFSAAS